MHPIETYRRKEFVKRRLLDVPLSIVLHAASWYLWGNDVLAHGYSVTYPIVSASLYIIGLIADKKTTETAIKHGAMELNPNLPLRPLKKDLYGLRTTAFDSFTIVLACLIPPIGITNGLVHLKTAFYNKRQTIES